MTQQSQAPYKKRLEYAATLVGIAQPLITLPQVITIYQNHSAQDVSLATWMGYLCFGIVFLLYGIVFKLRPIWISQTLWVSMQAITVAGILFYK